MENDDWGKYAPRNLFDGSKDTARVEGADGDGLGEQVWFAVDRETDELIVTTGWLLTHPWQIRRGWRNVATPILSQ